MATDRQSAGLTERRIRDAKPAAKTVFLWDETVKGLGVRITSKGAKAYVLFYRASGRKRLATLARCSELSLRDARERAGRELAAIRNGETDPLRRREEARQAPTVNDGLDRFFGEFVPRRIEAGRLTERTARDYRAQADRTIRPALGALKIADVTRDDIERAVAKRAPVQRNRTLALLSRVFNLFEAWEYRPQHTNPARGIEKAREEPRERVLAPSEIQALGAALDMPGDPFAAGAIRFLLMTGWRVGEALALRWEDINLETGEIVLPATKTGRQTRTVAGLALSVVAGLPRINGCPYVFAGAGDGPLSYGTLRGRFRAACKRAGIADCRLHDIRRSVATSAAASGLSPFLLRDLLNHKTVAMANRYARRAGSALQAAHDESAGRMAALLDGREKADVVPLRRGGSA